MEARHRAWRRARPAEAADEEQAAVARKRHAPRVPLPPPPRRASDGGAPPTRRQLWPTQGLSSALADLSGESALFGSNNASGNSSAFHNNLTPPTSPDFAIRKPGTPPPPSCGTAPVISPERPRFDRTPLAEMRTTDNLNESNRVLCENSDAWDDFKAASDSMRRLLTHQQRWEHVGQVQATLQRLLRDPIDPAEQGEFVVWTTRASSPRPAQAASPELVDARKIDIVATFRMRKAANEFAVSIFFDAIHAYGVCPRISVNFPDENGGFFMKAELSSGPDMYWGAGVCRKDNLVFCEAGRRFAPSPPPARRPSAEPPRPNPRYSGIAQGATESPLRPRRHSIEAFNSIANMR